MKGQTCIGPECNREQMERLEVCKSHRSQQLRGYEELFPLGKYRPKVSKPECSFEGCDRPRTGKQAVCTAHWQQQNAGKPLKPLRGSNKGQKQECSLSFCDRPARPISGLCPAHHEAQRQGRTLKPIERQGYVQPPCIVKDCDEPQMVRFELCKTHRYGRQRSIPYKKAEFDAWWREFIAGLGR